MKFAYLIEPPFNYADETGHITGCDVELARYVLGELGLSPFSLVETEFAQLLPGLAEGRWHMTTGMFEARERREMACFSRPIWALADGLLVRSGNPLNLQGYRSVAEQSAARLAVIRDQVQHRTALDLGVPKDRICVFETYAEAAKAVLDGKADAYASVARAHAGFIERAMAWPVELLLVHAKEKPPAFGAFAFGLHDHGFRNDVDAVLSAFLGTRAHRDMVAPFGFSDAEVDIVAADIR